MAINRNSEVTQAIIKGFKLQSIEGVPLIVNSSIVPTLETSPFLVKPNNIIKTVTPTASSTTLYTTPTNQDFYLTNVWGAYFKDGASTTSDLYVSCVIGGATIQIFKLPMLGSVAGNLANSIALQRPLKLDRGTNVVVQLGTGYSAVFSCQVSISGFVDETSNA